jgi:hypothetical protein
MDLLRSQAAHDASVFAREFPDQKIAFEDDPDTGGFRVIRQHYPEAHLTVVPKVTDGTVQVQYLFASADGTLAPHLLELVPEGEAALRNSRTLIPASAFTLPITNL